MKKLTAGIFAGILTIVSVNAADAAIASQGYVDSKVGVNTKAITNLNTIVGETDKDGLRGDVAKLQEDIKSVNGEFGSVADQIANALGNLGDDATVADALDKKQDKSTDNYSMGNDQGGWTPLKAEEVAALTSGITSDDVDQINTNKAGIKEINDKIGTIDEDKTVAELIDEAKNAATDGLDEKIGDLGDTTVEEALATKQSILSSATDGNITFNGEGNAVANVEATNGLVTVTKTSFIPEVTATGQTGTFVLTATVTKDGVTSYMWEEIKRDTSEVEG